MVVIFLLQTGELKYTKLGWPLIHFVSFTSNFWEVCKLVQMLLDCMSDVDGRLHRHHDDIMKLGKNSVFVKPLSARSLQFKINLNNPSAHYGWINTVRNFCDKKFVRNPQDSFCWIFHNIHTRTKIDACCCLYFARTISAILWHIAIKMTYFGSYWIPLRNSATWICSVFADLN
jgi:hypothetical protein